MIKYIKNADTETHTWVGQEIEPDAYHEIPSTQLLSWINDSDLLVDIANGTAVVAKSNDGTQNITDFNSAINYLKDVDLTPRDSDGSPLQRAKITTTGWHYQLYGMEFETSKLNSIVSKKVDNTDCNFTTMKYYKLVEGNEVEITGGDLTQEYLDSNCVKTIVDWEPNHDLEIIGGMLKQLAIPSEDLRVWVIGVPDVPEASGGSKPFAINLNLKFMGIEEGVKVDGRAPKYLTYSATYHTSKLRLLFRHPAGFKHKMHMIFELFKA